MQIEEKIKRQMEALLEAYPEGDFERTHFYHVLEGCEELALKRGLNTTVAKLTGMLHDVGRIMNASTGKQHAKEGEEIARRWLSEAGFEQLEAVTTAIKNHRHKKQIEDPYSELIKDADSLAHEREFTELPWAEVARIQMAYADKIIIKGTTVNLREILGDVVDRINRQLELNDLSVKAVHQLRVDLRMAETLIWWVKSDENHELEAFYNQIKVAFIRYEKLRTYQVYKKLLVSMEHLEPVEIMERLIENSKNELAQVPVIRISLPVPYELFASLERSDALLKKVKKRLEQVDLKRGESLHQFRIFNKRVMYLVKTGVIEVSPELLESVIRLHDVLGDLNDLRGLRKLFRKDSVFRELDEQLRKVCLMAIYQNYKAKRKVLKKEFLKIRLLLRSLD